MPVEDPWAVSKSVMDKKMQAIIANLQRIGRELARLDKVDVAVFSGTLEDGVEVPATTPVSVAKVDHQKNGRGRRLLPR